MPRFHLGGRNWPRQSPRHNSGALSRGSFRAAPGQHFEAKVSERLAHIGWEVSLTPGSGDGGVDVFCRCGSTVMVVQCKDWSNPVGIAAVQEIYTARSLREANLAVVVAANGFTRAARDAASKLGVMLTSFDELIRGCQLDRTIEGERLRAAERERREAERLAAVDVEWRRHDINLVVYNKKIASRPSEIQILVVCGLLTTFGLYLVGQSYPTLAVVLWMIGLTVTLMWLEASAPGLPPPQPSVPRRTARPESETTSIVGEPLTRESNTIRSCFSCGQSLRLPTNRSGRVKCPSCKQTAWYET